MKSWLQQASAPGDERPADAVRSPDAGSAIARVDEAIARACTDGASDIHFEVHRGGLQVKLRIDGVMTPAGRCDDARTAEEMISRIKVLAQLDITERRRPQDGRMRWQPAGGRGMDLRVSVMPSIHGEDAVLRLLDHAQVGGTRAAPEAVHRLDLGQLGFDEPTAARVRSLAARPHGMLLATGPTGSGKTTTIYAALCEANTGLQKIVTIEDPVEYELPGVLQIPVNEAKGLTFASGLRSILRHDPDRILVGEIRDAETAQIAVQSALTGHLVYTTVHANSLLDVLGRMRHLGIDSFALAASLNGVIVQRLLRRACAHCRAAQALRGCEHCRHTGYRGRLVVAEVHDIDESLREEIAAGAALARLRARLAERTHDLLRPRALALARAGHTTLEEITRVLGPD